MNLLAKKLSTNLVPLLLVALFLLHLASMKRLAPTYDEFKHLNYGKQLLTLNSNRANASKSAMPFAILNAIPSHFAGSQNTFPARLPTVLFSLLTAFFVFKWSRSLFGFVGGLLSLFLYACSPNIIAHSQLVTADIYATGMILIAVYAFWRFINNPSLKTASISALLLGLAQLAKYTAVYLYPILIIIGLVRLLSNERSKQDFWTMGNTLKVSALFIFIPLLVINIGFFFNQPLIPLGDYTFESGFFQSIQYHLRFFSRVPVLLPKPFLEGLDCVKNIDADIFPGRRAYLYLLGTTRFDPPFKIYYFIAYLFKEPLAAQAILGLSCFFAFKNRKNLNFLKNELFLFVPVIFFAIYFNFFFNTQIGIRYFLPVLPFLYVFSGSLAQYLTGPKLKYVVGGLLLYQLVSVLSYHRHYLSYFNELVWDRKMAYKVLADSNIDWGQSVGYLEDYLREHPDVKFAPEGMVSGKVIVGVNEFVGIFGPERYKWLRSYEPVGHVAYSYLIFDIPPQ